MSLEERIGRLERDARNWRRAAVALAVVLGAFLSCGRDATHFNSSPDPLAGAAAADGKDEPKAALGRSPDSKNVASPEPQKVLRIKRLEADEIEVRTIRAKEVLVVNNDAQVVGRLEAIGGGSLMLFGKDGPTGDGGAVRLGVITRPSCQIQGKDDQMILWDRIVHIVSKPGNKSGVLVGLSDDPLQSGFVEITNPLGGPAVAIQSARDNSGVVSVWDVGGKQKVLTPP